MDTTRKSAHQNMLRMDYVNLGCCALAFILYLNTLNAGFVYDDRRAILGNPDVMDASQPWYQLLYNDFWGTPLVDSGSHGSYRPLCVLSYKLNHIIGGFKPFGYHLVNILLHCLATGLVVKLARHILPYGFGTLISGVLFASHPIHTEAVAGIVGRADLIAHVQWREKCDSRHWLALCGAVLCASIAILCKETAISSLVVCVIYDILKGFNTFSKDKYQLRSIGILGIAIVTILHLRLSIPGPVTQFSTADNPTAKVNTLLTRFYTFSYLPVFNFKMLVYPHTLSFDWGMDAIPRITSFYDIRNLISLMFYAGLCRLIIKSIVTLRNTTTPKLIISKRIGRSIHKRKHQTNNSKSFDCVPTVQSNQLWDSENSCLVCKHGLKYRHASVCRSSHTKLNSASAILISISFLTLPFIPASNLFFYVGFVVAERILYLPSVGYCLLIGLGLGKLINFKVQGRSNGMKSKQKVQKSSLHSVRSITTMLFVIILISACSLKTMRRNQDWKDEESLYRSAIKVNPPKALGNLGSVLSSQGRFEEAEEALLGALKHRSNMADVHYNLGILYQNQQKYEDAVSSFQKAIHFRPMLALAYLNLGTSLIALGRCHEAASVLRDGTKLDGTGLRDRTAHEYARISSLLQLGGLYADQGKLQRALAVYREALHTLPQNYPPQGIYHRLGDVFMRLKKWSEAERFHRAALEAEPNHIGAHISYGTMLARNSSRSSEAEQYFKRAIRLAPLDSSVHHHYAEFLASISRHEEACESRVRAAELSPNDYQLVTAAATALRMLDRKNEAEKWYRQAVNLRPNDARAHTNLGAILHLMGRTQQATVSYKTALNLQPGDPTTLGNLKKLGVTEHS
ncbi:CLUMA_CG015797, isoform A [Clunio marinus]|uniref:dolichyl-phosphate-mannose--protein mannosyltransferase n=1 Tax=Clunio marinus TaxID=568069 RepID=A0A1J1ISB8_9DIPT|nr:CLUMA_CG015797, isoform A [Clunio marinus]